MMQLCSLKPPLQYRRPQTHSKATIQHRHFGKRWFSNIIRNALCFKNYEEPDATIPIATICAAGPSLDQELAYLVNNSKERFIIAVDTSLPVLLSAGLMPDAVISIDAQHISYRHFLDGLPSHTALYIDLAGSPVAAAQSKAPRFFSGLHPLSLYISYFLHSAQLDTSGGNVGYAALSLAEYLGAQSIEIVGADFSYPKGKTYSRGTYLSSLFGQRQSRFLPLESSFSNLLYRSSSLNKVGGGDTWYYQTALLAGYRKVFEQKIAAMQVPVRTILGGKAVTVRPALFTAKSCLHRQRRGAFTSPSALQDFFDAYRRELLALDPASNEVSDILTTILPTAASFQQHLPHLYGRDLIAMTKSWCIEKIENITTAGPGAGPAAGPALHP